MLNPIIALEQVLDEYRSYLLTEFRAKDPALRHALETALDEPGFLAQEPFYQAHRPFKAGARWKDLPLDPKLAGVLASRSGSETAYLHQSDAIAHLLGQSAGPLVVTTGTGSGKSECFLAPVIQNAIADAAAFQKNGLTALLVYPMNALANDQEERIRQYLKDSGWEGAVKVARYDRGTSIQERQALRANPPHILLTNYMMLEYLLVRPADRDALFANHRCRFLVLDEVHTYRGALGSNIALLVRRLKAHLTGTEQTWLPEPPPEKQALRYPSLVPVGTSATIKSDEESGGSPINRLQLREAAVQDFFGKLTGSTPSSIRVLAEALQEQEIPQEAVYGSGSPPPVLLDITDADAVRQTVAALAGLSAGTPLDKAARHARILWDLNQWLIHRPMSLSQIAAQLRSDAPGRSDRSEADLLQEAMAALVAGAALPDGTPGALRLRAHRFFRGGWRFHRCVNPACGRLYPRGEERCAECGHATAPLYLCRNCGADYLRFLADEPTSAPLQPGSTPDPLREWLLYDRARFGQNLEDEDAGGDEEPRPVSGRKKPTQIRGRTILDGSFDPSTLAFSTNKQDYDVQVTLLPGRTRCLYCGGTAGSHSVITPVALGTSAAVKVLGEGLADSLSEANHDRPGHDGKERLLVFSDSRQDAAHQARFIVFASRYDRMRRALVGLLDENGPLTLQRAVELLGHRAVSCRDQVNPHVPSNPDAWLTDAENERILAWEEAPLLDDLSVTAGYRGTIFNLGLAQVAYHRLDEYIRDRGEDLSKRLGLDSPQLEHLCRCILDEMRVRGCVNREMLRYHVSNPHCPASIRAADWERRVKAPKGYPVDVSKGADPDKAAAILRLDHAAIATGITLQNAWKGDRGRAPSLERIFESMQHHFGGSDPTSGNMVAILQFLIEGSFLKVSSLYGYQKSAPLLQVNSEIVRIQRVTDAERRRCGVCGKPCHGSPAGFPCPSCHGRLAAWPKSEILSSRGVQRILKQQVTPLVAAEHTAQVPGDVRMEYERQFKAPPSESSRNLLACSPTLEMGIDVGGLDAVVMRNVPPRPDNYAQRGGRAGRRTRVGLVVGYARSTPHDQYFYDRPAEMIAGEVPAPPLNLSNQDVLFRHLNAIAFGSADPGLAAKMIDYVDPQGNVKTEAVEALIQGVAAQVDHAVELASQAWGDGVLQDAGVTRDQLRESLLRLPDRIWDIIHRTARQVRELRHSLDTYAAELTNVRAGTRAGAMVARLLGISSGDQKNEADDRSSAYPLRRFAEFGVLPGYEFPSEPASLRLLGDDREDDPVTVVRRLGIAQFQPDAVVFARSRRWRVHGIDTSSPWNPIQGDASTYHICGVCELRYEGQRPACPRCGRSDVQTGLVARELGGFLALREEAPVFDEEERIPPANLVRAYPQWDGQVSGRWDVAGGWSLRLSREEEIWWLNEGRPPTKADRDSNRLMLTPEAVGHLVCPTCGRQLAVPEDEKPKSGGRKQVSQGGKDPYGHADDCTDKQPPVPAALLARGRAEILRLVVTLPEDTKPRDSPFLTWAASLGYSLSEGLQKLYMLDGPEIEFVLEGPWKASVKGKPYARASLTFIDPAVGGAGFLRRAAGEFHLVARRAIDHLDHSNCEDACYRCLKDYRNQRNHEYLSWAAAMPGLQALASEAPTIQSPQLGDSDDPEPWLEAYDAGVGSPLELRFLRLFAQHGLSVEKQVPVSPTIDGQPISAADFAIPDRRLAIYIDGAAYHRGANLRRDRAIRDRLRAGSPPWTVVELTAKDLGTWRPGDKGTWGQSDKGTWGLGIGGTWGWGEKQEINDRVH